MAWGEGDSDEPVARTGSRRIGIFGGTFDPPHVAHLAAAQEVLEAMDLERVWFVPTGTPPHKDRIGLTPAPLRLEMVRSAVADDPRFEALDLEVRRTGPSYTVDTLRELGEGWPATALHLLLGVDQWAEFGGWREPAAIAARAHLVLMTRDGERPGEVDPGLPGGTIPDSTEVPVPRLDISSTRLRERVRSGRSIRYLVPEVVRRIIEANELYV